MKLFDWFLRPARPQASADAAKERLQLILAIERSSKGGQGLGFLPQLQKDILEVIKKYVEIDSDKVSIEVERGETVSMLEVNVELPAGMEVKTLRAGAAVSPGAA